MMEDVCHDQRQKKEEEGGTGLPTSTLVQQRLCQHAEFRTTVAAHRHSSLCAGNIAGPGGFHLLVCGMSASDCLRRGETAFCTLSWIGGVWPVQLSSIDTFGFLQALPMGGTHRRTRGGAKAGDGAGSPSQQLVLAVGVSTKSSSTFYMASLMLSSGLGSSNPLPEVLQGLVDHCSPVAAP